MGMDNLWRPEPFLCKRKGDSEQLLQDFKQYRAELELFLTAAETVDKHMGDPAGRGEAGHTVCTTCKQEKAIIVLLGGEEMSELFERVGYVTDEDSYVGAMDKVEQGIKGLASQPRHKLFPDMLQDGRGYSERPQQANRCDETNHDKSRKERGRGLTSRRRSSP